MVAFTDYYIPCIIRRFNRPNSRFGNSSVYLRFILTCSRKVASENKIWEIKNCLRRLNRITIPK